MLLYLFLPQHMKHILQVGPLCTHVHTHTHTLQYLNKGLMK